MINLLNLIKARALFLLGLIAAAVLAAVRHQGKQTGKAEEQKKQAQAEADINRRVADEMANKPDSKRDLADSIRRDGL